MPNLNQIMLFKRHKYHANSQTPFAAPILIHAVTLNIPYNRRQFQF